MDCLPPPPCYNESILSGTSFAAAYVTGVAAQILQIAPHYTPAQVRDRLISLSSPVIKNPGDLTTNRLLRIYEGFWPPLGPIY